MIILIDGRSGAGKTKLATTLGTILGARVVHMDSFYPGWNGLAQASAIVAVDVLKEGGGFTQWDWEASKPAHWVAHGWTPGEVLIVEGCGSITTDTVSQARSLDYVFTIDLDGDEGVRRARVERRDGDTHSWWEMWARQEVEHRQDMPKVDHCLYDSGEGE